MGLTAGEIIVIGTRPYRVQHVNPSRAFCIPIHRGPASPARVDDPVDESEQVKGVRGINISPNAFVRTLTEAELVQFQAPRPEVRTTMTAAAIPVSSRTRSVPVSAEARRRADREAGIGTKRGTGRLVESKQTKANGGTKGEKTNPCLCGCGDLTGGYFVPGHDSRFKSWMIQIERGDMTPDELPAAVRRAYEFKKRGPGMVTTRNYKGEAHNGYDGAKNVKIAPRKR